MLERPPFTPSPLTHKRLPRQSFCYTNAVQSIDDIKARSKSGKYQSHGEISEADCIIGFSFGFRKNGDNIEPGLSNQDMAEIINNVYSALPKVLQFEIADAVQATEKQDDIYRIKLHSTPGLYLDTHEVAVQAKAIMEEHGWNKALLVAHPNHVPRVDAICTKLGIDTIVPDTLSAVRFDPESQQDWTRSLENWSNCEPKTIDDYVGRGWI